MKLTKWAELRNVNYILPEVVESLYTEEWHDYIRILDM